MSKTEVQIKPSSNRVLWLFPFIIWLFCMALSVVYISNNINVVSDIQQFMPSKSDDKHLQVLLHESQNSSASSLILVQLEGAAKTYLEDINQGIKNKLQDNKTLFSTILNGTQNMQYGSYSELMDKRYLLHSAGDFSVAELHTAFKNLINVYRTGSSDDAIDYLLADPQKSLVHYFKQLSTQQNIKHTQGVWFNEEGSKTYLMIQIAAKGFDLDKIEQGIIQIKKALSDVDELNSVHLTLSGPGVFAVETRDSIRHTTQLISVVLTLFVLFLFWFSYNSISLAFLGAIPLLSAIIVATAMTLFIFAELHGIVLAFGITLLGVCLDYPLHLFSHADKKETIYLTIKKIWPTLRLGAMTSILAYIALLGTGFDGLNQLAIFAAIGLSTALLITRYVLPIGLEKLSYKKRKVPIALPFSNHNKRIIITLIILGCLGVFFQADSIGSKDVSDINPVSKELRVIDKEIRVALHATDVNHLFLLADKNIEPLLVKTELLKVHLNSALKQNIISSVSAASDILPSQQQQRVFQDRLPQQSELEANVGAALKGLAFNKNAFNGFIQDVVEAKQQKPISYQQLSHSVLTAPLKSLLFQQNDQWYSLLRVSGVDDEQKFKHWLAQSPSIIADSYLSLHDATSTLMSNYLQATTIRLWVVIIIIIAVVLVLALKRRAILWLLPPVLLSVMMSVAVQVLLGHPITIFHMLSLLLVIGMGIDYSLFFSRDHENKKDLQNTTHAIFISALTTVVSFAILGLSGVPILAAMGQTVAVGIFCSFILAQRIAVPYKKLEEAYQ